MDDGEGFSTGPRALARLWRTGPSGPPPRVGACHDVPVTTATAPQTTTGPPPDPGSIRAALRPGTVVAVRDERSVQVGLAPDRAVVVGAPAACGPRRLAALLGALDGGAPVADAAGRAGIPSAALPAVARILVHLAELGHVRFPAAPGPAPGDAPGAGRPGPVRRVHLLGTGQVSQVLRGPLSVNGCRVTVGPSPGLTLDPDHPPWLQRGQAPDLVVLTDTVAVDPVLTAALARAGQTHLHVHCRDGRVVVGPTVVPGHTACLRCTDLYRADRDPLWPVVAAQLLGRSPGAEVPALTAAAALVLAEVAATREPDAPLQTLGASVEINPAEGLWRRREWPAHLRCSCGAVTRGSPLS